MTGQGDSFNSFTEYFTSSRSSKESIELSKISEKNQLELAGERIKAIKEAGSYYYIGRLSLSAFSFFSKVFFDILGWYLLPVVALGAIFRSYLNIREWQEAQAANANLLRKVILNTGMALGSIAAVVLFFTLGAAFLGLLPGAMALFYTGTFLFKTCQSAYYLYNFFKAEPGSDYRNECWDRFKRYGTSALASLFAAGIAVFITLTHVISGPWATLGLFATALIVNTYNTATVAYGDLSKGPSKIEAALKHFKFINDKPTKQAVLIQLMNDKIKSLDKEIKALTDLKAETDALSWGFKKFINKIKLGYHFCVSASPKILAEKKVFLETLHDGLKNNQVPHLSNLLENVPRAVFNGETALLAHAVEDLDTVTDTTVKPKLDYNENIIDTMKLIKAADQRTVFLFEQIKNKRDTLADNQLHKKDFLNGLHVYLDDISRNLETSLTPDDFLKTCNLENNTFTAYRHNKGQTETLFYAVATHYEMLKKDAGQVSAKVLTKGNERATKNLKDIEALVKSIDNPLARKRYMLELLNIKITELSRSIAVSSKAKHKFDALVWLRSWIEYNQKPKPFTVHVKRPRVNAMVDWLLPTTALDSHTANTKMIYNMRQWLEHLEKDIDFKDDVYSAYVPSFGETHILIRTVVAYVEKYDKEQKAPKIYDSSHVELDDPMPVAMSNHESQQKAYDVTYLNKRFTQFSTVVNDGIKQKTEDSPYSNALITAVQQSYQQVATN